VKSLVGLLEDLLHDCGRMSGAPVSRDVKTLRSRVEHEGDSFITITLPNFARDFERSLALCSVRPGMFLSFKKRGHAGIPAFMQGFLTQVFDAQGILLANPSVDCIRAVRQVCLFGKKIQRSCSKEREQDAIDEYKQCDDSVSSSGGSDQLHRYFEKVAEILISDLGVGIEDFLDMMPRHGPGATREHISGNGKWRFLTWHERLSDVGFTHERFARALQGPHDPSVDDPLPVPVNARDEPPVRVVLVPKTLKTPRVIAVEPVCMQFAQQGLKAILVHRMETSVLTGGHVNFTDQSVNQELALLSSSDGRFATIDMKEASDRVSLAHAKALLKSNQVLLDWVMACRSTSAELPNGEILSLKKFASMGSALCFPVEALVFYTSIIASRIWRAGRFPTRRLVYEQSRDVYVYGDDLIFPADEAPATCTDLEALGFKVNRHKSFWTGKFRESCGVDGYDGSHVTPVYMRRDLPTSRKDSSGIVSTVATCNQLHAAGYVRCAMAMKKAVERVLGKLPQVPVDSPALGWHFHSEVVPRLRWNRFLQRRETRCYVAETPSTEDPLEGDSALAKCFRLLAGRVLDFLYPPTQDEDHLEFLPRPYSLTLKRRWVSLV